MSLSHSLLWKVATGVLGGQSNRARNTVAPSASADDTPIIPGVTLTYDTAGTWLRAETVTADWVDGNDGAENVLDADVSVSATYLLDAGDVGLTIYLRETGTGADGISVYAYSEGFLVEPTFAIGTAALTDSEYGVPYSLTLTANKTVNDWTLTGLPTGLSEAAGVISGTPADAVDTYSVQIDAETAEGETDSVTLDLGLTWSPYLLTGLLRWHRADQSTLLPDGTGTVEDGSPVGRSTDLSANTGHQKQSVTGFKPTYDAGGGLNGQPALVFAYDDYMKADAAFVLSGDFDVWAIAKHKNSTSENLIGPLTNSNQRVGWTNNNRMILRTDSGALVTITMPSSFGLDTYKVFQWQRASTTYTARFTNVSNTAAIDTADVTLGELFSAGVAPSATYEGAYCEIIIVNGGVVSGADLTNLIAYLNDRYDQGLT